MLRSMKRIVGYRVHTTDEGIGKVDDFYFDDLVWVVRYVVVDTGKWLPGRRVLISPSQVGEADWESGALPVALTAEALRQCPGIESDLPVSLQEEIAVERYPVWAPYWPPVGSPVAGVPPVPVHPFKSEGGEQVSGDRHLRSVREVIHYRIEAPDGNAGHVEDFVLDDGAWALRYLVVDTRNWLPGRKVLISREWIERVNWSDKEVQIDLTREQIQNSPPYDPSAPLNREYEVRLYDYYGRPKSWA